MAGHSSIHDDCNNQGLNGVESPRSHDADVYHSVTKDLKAVYLSQKTKEVIESRSVNAQIEHLLADYMRQYCVSDRRDSARSVSPIGVRDRVRASQPKAPRLTRVAEQLNNIPLKSPLFDALFDMEYTASVDEHGAATSLNTCKRGPVVASLPSGQERRILNYAVDKGPMHDGYCASEHTAVSYTGGGGSQSTQFLDDEVLDVFRDFVRHKVYPTFDSSQGRENANGTLHPPCGHAVSASPSFQRQDRRDRKGVLHLPPVNSVSGDDIRGGKRTPNTAAPSFVASEGMRRCSLVPGRGKRRGVLPTKCSDCDLGRQAELSDTVQEKGNLSCPSSSSLFTCTTDDAVVLMEETFQHSPVGGERSRSTINIEGAHTTMNHCAVSRNGETPHSYLPRVDQSTELPSIPQGTRMYASLPSSRSGLGGFLSKAYVYRGGGQKSSVRTDSNLSEREHVHGATSLPSVEARGDSTPQYMAEFTLAKGKAGMHQVRSIPSRLPPLSASDAAGNVLRDQASNSCSRKNSVPSRNTSLEQQGGIRQVLSSVEPGSKTGYSRSALYPRYVVLVGNADDEGTGQPIYMELAPLSLFHFPNVSPVNQSTLAVNGDIVTRGNGECSLASPGSFDQCEGKQGSLPQNLVTDNLTQAAIVSDLRGNMPHPSMLHAVDELEVDKCHSPLHDAHLGTAARPLTYYPPKHSIGIQTVPSCDDPSATVSVSHGKRLPSVLNENVMESRSSSSTDLCVPSDAELETETGEFITHYGSPTRQTHRGVPSIETVHTVPPSTEGAAQSKDQQASHATYVDGNLWAVSKSHAGTPVAATAPVENNIGNGEPAPEANMTNCPTALLLSGAPHTEHAREGMDSGFMKSNGEVGKHELDNIFDAAQKLLTHTMDVVVDYMDGRHAIEEIERAQRSALDAVMLESGETASLYREMTLRLSLEEQKMRRAVEEVEWVTWIGLVSLAQTNWKTALSTQCSGRDGCSTTLQTMAGHTTNDQSSDAVSAASLVAEHSEKETKESGGHGVHTKRKGSSASSHIQRSRVIPGHLISLTTEAIGHGAKIRLVGDACVHAVEERARERRLKDRERHSRIAEKHALLQQELQQQDNERAADRRFSAKRAGPKQLKPTRDLYTSPVAATSPADRLANNMSASGIPFLQGQRTVVRSLQMSAPPFEDPNLPVKPVAALNEKDSSGSIELAEEFCPPKYICT